MLVDVFSYTDNKELQAGRVQAYGVELKPTGHPSVDEHHLAQHTLRIAWNRQFSPQIASSRPSE